MNQQQMAVVDALTKEWADKGLIVEGGWRAFVATALKDAPEQQVREMRKAYFLGAQHVFASMLSFLDGPGDDATEQDMRRMGLLHNELDAFGQSLLES